MSAQAVGAFQQRVPTAFANTAKLSFPSAPSPVSKGRQHVSQLMSIDDISNYYATYPLQAAVVTCGVKASVADFIAQVRAWSRDDNSFEMRRNLAYILYGGIFIGMMCHIEYDFVFPLLFGTEQTLEKIAERVLFDVFISVRTVYSSI